MKIGILAFQEALNYGAALQIYALQKTIEKFIPSKDTVEVINYEQPLLTQKRKLYDMDENFLSGFLKSSLLLPSKYLRRKRFNNFYNHNINLSTKTNDIKTLKTFDTIVVGSDQVWNSEIHNYDTSYLLDTYDDVIKIAYAASIGKERLTKKDKELFMRYLPKFSDISVRESSAKELISEYTENKINVTLDPTLLLTAQDWRKVIKENKTKENKNENKYILVYHMEENDELYSIANEVSNRMNLPLKFIKPPSGNKLNKLSTKYTYGPEEFLSLIDNSEFIITNSFHGTCFSIIFNKNFITIPHMTRGSRMIDLLSDLKLDERIIYNLTELSYNTHVLKTQDFSKANILLEKMKLDSTNFLKNALLNSDKNNQ